MRISKACCLPPSVVVVLLLLLSHRGLGWVGLGWVGRRRHHRAFVPSGGWSEWLRRHQPVGTGSASIEAHAAEEAPLTPFVATPRRDYIAYAADLLEEGTQVGVHGRSAWMCVCVCGQRVGGSWCWGLLGGGFGADH